jgi:hypothetical protein
MVALNSKVGYWAGIVSCAAASWLSIRWLDARAGPPILPMLGFLLWSRAYGGVWAAGLGAFVFGLLARTLLHNVTEIPRSSTLFLILLTILWVGHVVGQVYTSRAESYHIDLALSVLSILTELMILSGVWAIWLYGRRAASSWRRVLFSGSVTVYFVSAWRGSGVWFNGF